ncbi:hypothetical protein GQX73_g9742 [Xylaria multiplex]|uniref:Receptor L-domain domain-containing protein n=1 Tax=Xylaria multiplex TaxID=323545 RepID=A0A7C8MG93_9PEZI|nr:hypothetical protein GQX73_g9742 [Xylaria multiplex]
MGDFQTCTVNITNQADIESGSLSSCPENAYRYINIRNATSVLNFTNLTETDYIDVAQSPQLEILDFPHLTSLRYLAVNGATALESILMRQLSSLPSDIHEDGSYTLPIPFSAINITECPNLLELNIQNTTGLHVLALQNVSLSSLNPNITSVVILETDSCLGLPDLRSTRDFHLTGTGAQGCFLFSDLSSAHNFTLTSISPSEVVFGQAALTVIDTLTLESSVVTSDYDNTLKLDSVASVGSNAFITSNANAHIEFDSLVSVKGNLSIKNNQNCTFNFDNLGDVGNLLLMDNLNTTLPTFPSLARANSIHLRGYIDKSNIFPALTSVSDSVIIEALNDDFNCSKLVSQYQAGTIPNLSCNGTSNGTGSNSGEPSSSPSPAPNDSLSQGAKAGIGVGVAVGVLGAAVAIIWLVLRFKIQLKKLSQRNPTAPPIGDNGAAQKQEHEVQGAIQEKPDDQIHQIGESTKINQAEGRMIIQENQGNGVHELASMPSELPGNSVQRTPGPV